VGIEHKESMKKMNLQITGRCNYNCIHCFNAKDNSPLQSELKLSEITHLLDECVVCGIQSFTITGGEPMIHPQYKEIIEAIYQRGMTVFELNTNGFYIDQKMLDWMKEIHYEPLIKISFDGLGFHNWMRGSSLAEEKTLDAIKLCIENGFKVKVQINVNKKNVSSILPTLVMLDKMGVREARMIKTTDAPRWLQNANGQSMSFEEYYDAMLDILKGYLSEERHMVFSGWLICRVDPYRKYFNLDPVVCEKDDFSMDHPLCNGITKMIAVGSNGNVYPCLQSQGYFDQHEMVLGNVISDGLKNILEKSKYKDLILLTAKDKLEAGATCKECEFLEACAGGCPAMALLSSGDYLLADKSKCVFFKQGYYDKFVSVIPGEYMNIKPLCIHS